MLPFTPVWLEEAAGVAAFLNVMTLPFTFRVAPSWTRLPSVPAPVVRDAVTVAGPEPVEVVRRNAFSRSAWPDTLRSAPVEVSSTTLFEPLTLDAVWPALVASEAEPEE